MTPRTALKRRAARGSHERAVIDAILDEALVCHLGVSLPDGPRVLPTAHVRIGDHLYVHGARRNQLLCAALDGPVCITVTLLDGLVMSREAFHHSVNYRSVVLFGLASELCERSEKRVVLRALVEHVAPGRWDEVIAPTDEELDATLVIALPIEEGSAKVRTGAPNDSVAQANKGIWAGEIPLRQVALAPRVDVLDEVAPVLSPAVLGRARELGLGSRTPYERVVGELLVSTDPARLDGALVHGFLCNESYWAKGVTESAFQKACAESLCFGLYRGREQLAFARVITDTARFAYLADVFVVKEERGRGLGKLLLDEIFSHPALREIDRWLLGTADAHTLYERYGFVPTPQGRFMVRNR